ncbi:MAG: hypothetical protein GY754_12680 [bacterium]|nr:hypothetical protein [bacterium]
MTDKIINIDTTINIKGELLEKLLDASAEMGLSRNKIIILLMRRVIENKDLPVVMFHQVHYQARMEDANWHRVHVWLPPEVYESWQDLRKFHKMSISAIIAFAIHEYLDIVLMQSTLTRDPYFADNYLQQYFFTARDSGSIQRFVTFWGFPGTEELGKHFD